jgi:hypothetical protein
MRLKRIRLLHVFRTFAVFFLMSALFFPFLRVTGEQKNSYQRVSTSGTVDYPPPPDPPLPVYPFWSDNSYWHMKIPANVRLHPNSAEMVNWLKSKDGHNDGHPFINYKLWTAPVYEVYEASQTVVVYDYVHNQYYDVPIPAGAKPSEDADHQLVIIDWYQRKTWDFWNLQYVDGEWRAGAAYVWGLDGTGVSPNGQWTVGGASIPLTAGIIRDEEIEAGVINHPLLCSLHTPKANRKVYPPAATADGRTYDTWAIPEGARIQLNPDLDLDSLGLSRTAKIIAKALQEYGMVVKESAGSFAIYAEHTNTADWSKWSLTGNILTSIPAQWRIVDYSVFDAAEEYWQFP